MVVMEGGSLLFCGCKEGVLDLGGSMVDGVGEVVGYL